jgi:hypothetical protein
MTQSNADNKLTSLVQELQGFAFTQQGSMTILRVVGYGLLVLAVFDVVEILTPPSFMNPVWEFQTLGGLVEHVPVPLIGMALVFYGEMYARNKREILILKGLSWLTLVFAIIFILLVPLGIIDSVRINKQTTAQIGIISEQQISKAEQLEKNLNAATPQQIENFLKSRGQSLHNTSPEQAKSQLLTQVGKAEAEIKTKAKTTESSQKLALLKSSVKWNLGALVSGTLFFMFWRLTSWARS